MRVRTVLYVWGEHMRVFQRKGFKGDVENHLQLYFLPLHPLIQNLSLKARAHSHDRSCWAPHSGELHLQKLE